MNQFPVRLNGAAGRALARFSGASALSGSGGTAGAATAWPRPAGAGACANASIPGARLNAVRIARIGHRIDLVIAPPLLLCEPASPSRRRRGRGLPRRSAADANTGLILALL